MMKHMIAAKGRNRVGMKKAMDRVTDYFSIEKS